MIFQEPDLLFDSQLVGEPVGDQVVDDFERGGQEIGARVGRVAADCER